MGKRIKKYYISKSLLIIVVFMTLGGMAEAYAQATSVYRIQSLFIYNFTKHVKWKNSVNESFTVGVFGNTLAFKEVKQNLEGKKAWGKNIIIIELESTQESINCHLVYLPKSNKKKILDFIEEADLANILLVTEDDLMDEGASISFFYEKTKMKFKISKVKIEGAGLKVSGSLISMGIAL
jgi:hypothetical protein